MKLKRRSIFTDEGIAKIEAEYNAKYMLDCALRAKDGAWSLSTGAIFYQDEAYPETGSHYFALYFNPLTENLMITDASWIEDIDIKGIMDGDRVAYSIHRHDYVTNSDGQAIDGGRDYLRTMGDPDLITIFIKDGEVNCHTLSK